MDPSLVPRRVPPGGQLPDCRGGTRELARHRRLEQISGNREQGGGTFGVSGIQLTENRVNRQGEIGGSLIGQPLVVAALQQIEYHMDRIDDQLFIEDRQYAAAEMVVLGGGIVFRNLVHGDHGARFVRRAPSR